MIHEAYVFLSAIAAGLVAGFLYDLFRLKRKAMKTKALIVTVEDVIYWILAAMLVFITAYVSNEGEVRLYFFLAVIVGVILYFSLLSKWVTFVLTWIAKISVWPFVQIYHILKPVVVWVYRLLGKEAEKAKGKMHIASVRANRRLKSIRHILRKI